MFPLLKQAACCGSLDAMYVVSVILNNGLFVKADNIQVYNQLERCFMLYLIAYSFTQEIR